METNKNMSAAAEALLFIHGEPLKIKKIAKILEIEESVAESVLNDLKNRLDGEDGGLRLILTDDSVQLATKPEFSKITEDFIKDEFQENLSPAALETMSIIAYLGPISRAKIEHIRGVNSSFILRILAMRGLMERNSDKQSYLYKLSFECLKRLGISKIEELPEYEKYRIPRSLNLFQNSEKETENK